MTPRRGFVPAPRWNRQQLDEQRLCALQAFIDERKQEDRRQYVALFEESLPQVEQLFSTTRDLLDFTGKHFEDNKGLVDPARFLGGPPISDDDLKTFVDDRLGRAKIPAEVAERVADVIRSAWDPLRLPWTKEGRSPTSQERELAIRWTTGIWVIERLRTLRRTQASRVQERQTAGALSNAEYEEVPRREIHVLDDLERGQFCREARVAGAKCDLPVRLRDGRLLAIECKVSNTAVNSVKRLNRETGGKADTWRSYFGDQVVTAAVLAGVYNLANLEHAQNIQRVTLFWQHDLEPLQQFVRQVASSQ